MDKLKCFRHQIKATKRYCRLCFAKTEAKGRFEYARILYVRGLYA